MRSLKRLRPRQLPSPVSNALVIALQEVLRGFVVRNVSAEDVYSALFPDNSPVPLSSFVQRFQEFARSSVAMRIEQGPRAPGWHGAAVVNERFDLGDERAPRRPICPTTFAQACPIADVPGCPSGSDDAIVEMSAAPAHTACPNPYLREWVERHLTTDEDRPDPGPFAADSQAGKTSVISGPTATRPRCRTRPIMRLILHYTKPGDIVLDGFCGHRYDRRRCADVWHGGTPSCARRSSSRWARSSGARVARVLQDLWA